MKPWILMLIPLTFLSDSGCYPWLERIDYSCTDVCPTTGPNAQPKGAICVRGTCVCPNEQGACCPNGLPGECIPEACPAADTCFPAEE